VVHGRSAIWNLYADGRGEAYPHGSQVLDTLWQHLNRGGPMWDVWMEVRVPSDPAWCCTDVWNGSSRPIMEGDEFLARGLTRREAYDFIQPHIMMLGPL
jgi:hypothetical protein